eukprot:TRINITY_DN4813_c0_g1_i1.p2 TRINITY_DN4813_c0_g1~~TRINITY_DN4813_c0_g1_i1.p2  ORF type:complete len:165 (-),score=37.56 TRINITY_DN4813_c0_g1_i1:246-740(-)
MKAYRLTQKFMRDMKENDTLKKELISLNRGFEDVFEAVQVRINCPASVSLFLAQHGTEFGSSRKSKDLEVFTTDHSGALEKSLEFLIDSMDGVLNEQAKLLGYQKSVKYFMQKNKNMNELYIPPQLDSLLWLDRLSTVCDETVRLTKEETRRLCVARAAASKKE